MADANREPERGFARVLKAARVNDELGIAQRHAEANSMLDQAKQSSVEMLSMAREQGFEEGRSTVLKATLEEVRRILNEFSMLVRMREEALANIIIQSVEKIVGQAPPQDQVRMLLSTALTDMLDSFTVILKVAAEDLTMVREVLSKLQEQGEGQNVVSVLVDPLLTIGEMLLETERGRIHIGLGQQFSRLRAGFQQAAHPRA